MEDIVFPRWIAPFLGAGVGAFVAVRTVRREGEEMTAQSLLVGAAVGLVAGGLIWFLDRPATRKQDADVGTSESEDEPPAAVQAAHGSLISRLLALLSIFLVCAPIVGLGLSIAAVVMNRRVMGWPRKVAWIATWLSLFVTVVFLIMLAFAPSR